MIIFLNGSKDAGKTTTASIIKGMDPRFAVVEPDVFYEFLPEHLPLLEKAPYCVEMSALCIERLSQLGYHVIVAYPITKWDHERYLHLLPSIPVSDMLFITLLPEKDKLLRRLGLEHEESDEAKFRRLVIDSHYERNGGGYGVVAPEYPTHFVDNSDLTPEETAAAVYEIIEGTLRNRPASSVYSPNVKRRGIKKDPHR